MHPINFTYQIAPFLFHLCCISPFSLFFNSIFSLFTFQMLSPFLVLPQKIPCPILLPLIINQLTNTSWPWHSLTQEHRAFIGPRDSPPIDNQQCYICSWSHESHHVYSLVGGLVSGSSEWSCSNVLTMGFQHPLALLVFSLVLSLGSLGSV